MHTEEEEKSLEPAHLPDPQRRFPQCTRRKRRRAPSLPTSLTPAEVPTVHTEEEEKSLEPAHLHDPQRIHSAFTLHHLSRECGDHRSVATSCCKVGSLLAARVAERLIRAAIEKQLHYINMTRARGGVQWGRVAVVPNVRREASV